MTSAWPTAPECSAELLVYFDKAIRKKVIRPVDEVAITPKEQKRAAAPHQGRTESREKPNPVASRFGKIE